MKPSKMEGKRRNKERFFLVIEDQEILYRSMTKGEAIAFCRGIVDGARAATAEILRCRHATLPPEVPPYVSSTQ